MKAVWNGTVLAESDNTIIIENNHYFPPDSVKLEFFISSDKKTHCPWKGDASYFTIKVKQDTNIDAAWYYPSPMDAAAEIKDYVAFWKGVEVSE